MHTRESWGHDTLTQNTGLLLLTVYKRCTKQIKGFNTRTQINPGYRNTTNDKKYTDTHANKTGLKQLTQIMDVGTELTDTHTKKTCTNRNTAH